MRLRTLVPSSRAGILLLAAALGGTVVRAEPGPRPGAASSPPPSSAPALGRGHVWLKIGRTDIDADARDWGIDRTGYLALEGFFARGQHDYFGLECGRFEQGEATSPDGDRLRDIDSYWLEFNGKHTFGLRHGISFDVGTGAAIFYIDGEEVTTEGVQEFSDPLADIGFGVQLFGGFTWRSRHLLMGIDVKYQWAFDIIDIDYSNLRVGAHLGVAF